MTETYPLAWPQGWARTAASARQESKFHTVGTQHSSGPNGGSWKVTRPLTIEAAMRRLSDELERLGAREIVLSSNLERRLDGQPRSSQRSPADPGIAVYFKRKGQPIVLACDRWTTCAGNIAAIAGHIDAIRRMERYGVGSLDRVFTGYAALPAPGQKAKRQWWVVLGMQERPTGIDSAESLYRIMARRYHPDNKDTGSTAMMAEINAAIADARTEFGARGIA